MSRIRTIKPDFWTSEQVMGCSRDARLLFVGMWNFADDSGVLPASIQRIRAQVFPGDDVSLESIRLMVTELSNGGLIEEYDVEGKVYWRITGFTQHQRIDWPNYRHPLPDGRVPDKNHRLSGKQRQLMMRRLIERDGERCQHCGAKDSLQIDHVMPFSKGGSNEPENLQLLCKKCNSKKFTNGDSQVTRG